MHKIHKVVAVEKNGGHERTLAAFTTKKEAEAAIHVGNILLDMTDNSGIKLKREEARGE